MPNLSSTIKLNLDSSAVKRGVKDMKQRFQAMGKAMVKSMAVVGVATFAYFNKFRNEMDRIGKLSKRLEESPETLQRIGLAAELAGTDMETVVKGAQKLVRSLVEASNGSKTYERALDALGIKSEELLEMGLEDQIIAISKAYVESNKGGRELAAIQDLLGRSGAELIPLLREGPEELAAAMARAKPVSAEVVGEMEYINDQLTVMGQKAQFVFGKVLVEGWRYIRVALNEAGTQIAMMMEALTQLKNLLTGEEVTQSGLAYLRDEGNKEHRRIMREGKPPTPEERRAQLKQDLIGARAAYEESRGGMGQEKALMELKAILGELRKLNNGEQFAYGN